MKEYEIIDTNAGSIGGCGFCGYKSGKNEGHRRKCDWLKQRYAEGLRFKIQKGPHDPGCRSVSYGSQVCEGYCRGIKGLGVEAEGGSNQERQGIKGASNALWRV
jgi:hypothetical protein